MNTVTKVYYGIIALLLCIIIGLVIVIFSLVRDDSKIIEKQESTQVKSETGSNNFPESINTTAIPTCGEIIKDNNLLSESNKVLFNVYKDIDSLPEVKKDLYIIFDVFVNKDCSDNLDQYDKKACNFYILQDKTLIEKDSEILPEDKNLLLSLIDGKNLCQGSDTCETYFNIYNGVKNKTLNFPETINDKPIEFAVYKKVFPDIYEQKLIELLSGCPSKLEN